MKTYAQICVYITEANRPYFDSLATDTIPGHKPGKAFTMMELDFLLDLAAINTHKGHCNQNFKIADDAALTAYGRAANLFRSLQISAEEMNKRDAELKAYEEYARVEKELTTARHQQAVTDLKIKYGIPLSLREKSQAFWPHSKLATVMTCGFNKKAKKVAQEQAAAQALARDKARKETRTIAAKHGLPAL